MIDKLIYIEQCQLIVSDKYCTTFGSSPLHNFAKLVRSEKLECVLYSSYSELSKTLFLLALLGILLVMCSLVVSSIRFWYTYGLLAFVFLHSVLCCIRNQKTQGNVTRSYVTVKAIKVSTSIYPGKQSDYA